MNQLNHEYLATMGKIERFCERITIGAAPKAKQGSLD